MKEKIKAFFDKQKLKKFSTTKPALQEMLKVLLAPEMKKQKYIKLLVV